MNSPSDSVKQKAFEQTCEGIKHQHEHEGKLVSSYEVEKRAAEVAERVDRELSERKR